MKDIDFHKTPQDVIEYLKRYKYFKVKRAFSTLENKFYVGTKITFTTTESIKEWGWHEGLKIHINSKGSGLVEYCRFSVTDDPFKKYMTTFKSIDDVLKTMQPIIIKDEKYRFKFKLCGLEITLK